MPMEADALSDLKSLIAAARRGPLAFGVCMGKKPEETVMLLHRTKSAEVLGKSAKKQGETAKVAFGEIEVSGKKASLTCHEDPPPGIARSLKLFFSKTVEMPLKVILLSASSSPSLSRTAPFWRATATTMPMIPPKPEPRLRTPRQPRQRPPTTTPC